MNYLIFDNEIYYLAGEKAGHIPKGEINSVLSGTNKEALVLVIDAQQQLVPAPEKDISKRDDILASSFPEQYITQAEPAGHNLYQVVAIEKTKINEIYQCLGFANVKLVIPYAVAVRSYLQKNNLLSEDKKVVFLDHLGTHILLTFFGPVAFSVPRRLPASNRVVSELRRSQENYRNQEKGEGDIQFFVVSNSHDLIDEIVAAGGEPRNNTAYIDEQYAALKGLKDGKFNMHFLLPEQLLKIRKFKEAKKRLFSLGVCGGFLALFLTAFLGLYTINKNTQTKLTQRRLEKDVLSEKLKTVYAGKYQDIIAKLPKIDFPKILDSFLNAVAKEYKVETAVITKLNNGWYRFEGVTYLESKDRLFSHLDLPKFFKDAKRENILVKESPGERVILDIYTETNQENK